MICSLYEIDGRYVQIHTRLLDDGPVNFMLFTDEAPRYHNSTRLCRALEERSGHCQACGRHLYERRLAEGETTTIILEQLDIALEKSRRERSKNFVDK